ncbi:hypothetical protein FOL47_005042 [Perkinsus chesapeaki]|uniref:P-type ATPase A domain-containing protein n=1 Tax=Perkinsus chesapeaki TaxID=330153 RepID=A0A7J6LZB0_PERCH|nr:hypothetical protein FOL47_005042 [Perkinsus chesapeaki]
MPAAPEPAEADQGEIRLWAPFYLINYAIFAVICALHLTVYFRSRGKSGTDGHLVDLPTEGVTQRGYRRDYFGSAVKWLGILWLLWIEVALLTLVIGQYNGSWPFYSVDFEPTWNSFTRGFLAAWVTSTTVLMLLKRFSNFFNTLYLLPSELLLSDYVMMSSMCVDECGGVNRHSELCPVETAIGASRWVTFQLRRYSWRSARDVGPPAFEAATIYDPRGPTAREIHSSVAGHDAITALNMLKEHGKNEIVIPVPSFVRAAGIEYFNYFYIYQLCAVWLTVYWDYVTYGLLLAVLAISSGLVKVYTERRQRFELRNMARVSGTVWVKRDRIWMRTTSDLVVQGDLIALMNDDDTRESAGLLAVDAMVVRGNAVVDESLLTGETMPIQKFNVPGPSADPDSADMPRSKDTENKKHYVFAGTKLLSATGAPKEDLPTDSSGTGCLLVVTHTSAETLRGSLLRTLLFGAPLKLAWASEIRIVLCILIAFGLVEFFILNAQYSFSLGSILTACFSIVGMINPLLSIAILGGQLAAASRLRADKSKRTFRLIGRSAKERGVAGSGARWKSPPIADGDPSLKTWDAIAADFLPFTWQQKLVAVCAGHVTENIWRPPELRERNAQAAFTNCDHDGDIGGNLRVYCRDVERLTLTGRLTQMCFDKTGTLTKTGLDFVGIVRMDPHKPTAPPKLLSFTSGPPSNGVGGLLGPALALAHTVSIVGKNQRVGHQVELRMVEAAASLGWRYDRGMSRGEDPIDEGKWEVLKQHTFDHHSMTMSVVARNITTGKTYVFCKGSHEAVMARCTLHGGEEGGGSDARDIFEGLVVSAAERYASEGCYVLAIAAKELTREMETRLPRHEVESGMSLLGLLLFRNELKPDSSRHIDCLRAGGVDSVMITGDSVLTGATVARKVGIIPRGHRVVIGGASSEGPEIEWRDLDSHDVVPESVVCGPGCRPTSLCVTGACFAALLRSDKLVPLMGCRGECENSTLPAGVRRPGLVDCGCSRIRVFGRMTPHQKVAVITSYSRAPLNLITGMCGDGGNDSGALRAAAAGLALSGRVEASVAAPFSTDSPSIGSLVLLLREARASMCTSFASYRFLVVRGILGAMGKIILLSMVGAYLAPLGYLFQDLIMTPLLLWAISMARPARTLAEVAPEGSLLGPAMITASVFTVLILTFFLLVALGILYLNDGETWFGRFIDENSDIHEWQKRSDNFEAALTWVWMSWATVDTAVCYSYGHVHRRAVYRNLALVTSVVALGVPILVLLLNGSCSYNCAFKVNCHEDDYFPLKDSWFNYFLFSYEEIGGTEWYNSVPSNVLPVGLRWGFFALFTGMTIFHHLSYKIITLGPCVQKVLPSWGWGARDASAGVVSGGGRSFQLPKLRVLGKKLKRKFRRSGGGKSKTSRRDSIASLATDADFTGMDFAEDRFSDIQHVAFQDEISASPDDIGEPVILGRSRGSGNAL